MKIGIIGAGNVGSTLGRAWSNLDHDVMFGVREPSSSKAAALLASTGGRSRAGSVSEAANFAEVIALATPWEATRSAILEAGALAGKVVIDCTNPLKPDLSGLLVGTTTSGAEQVAGWAPAARVVKAFNTTGFENMADANFGGEAATMIIAGDDAPAKALVSGLVRDVGFEPVDAGPLAMARLLEPMALLWINLAVMRGLGTRIVFQLVRK